MTTGTKLTKNNEFSQLSPAELDILRDECDTFYQAAEDKFVSTYMSLDEYEVEYNSDFTKVRRDLEFLMSRTLHDEDNYPFYMSLETLYHHRRWQLKQGQIQKSTVHAYDAHCRLVQSSYPGLDLPAFLDKDIHPNNRDYRFHIDIMVRIRKKFDLALQYHIVSQSQYRDAPLSPFAPVYFDWSRTKPAKPALLWATTQGFKGNHVVELNEIYETVDDSVKEL